MLVFSASLSFRLFIVDVAPPRTPANVFDDHFGSDHEMVPMHRWNNVADEDDDKND